MKELVIPADVPPRKKDLFAQNMQTISKETDHIFLFSCDQKIEHLHDDFDPDEDDIPEEAVDPEHFFKIGSQGRIGAMATQLELIARYAPQYPDIPYVAKLNSKTNLIPTEQKEPLSVPLWGVKEVKHLIEESNLTICGVGITIYLGSEFEDKMMHFAAKSIFEAHKHGLLAIIWMYPRGKAVADESDAHLLAGAAGAANALGADIVKIKPPHASENKTALQELQEIVAAAGNTHVICSGGSKVDPEAYLRNIYEQIHTGGVAGTATGRNVFQNTLPQAIGMTKAISVIVYDGATVEDALVFINHEK